MGKVLFADLSEKERIQMLSDNADTVEEVGYMKAFTPDEMEEMKDRLSKNGERNNQTERIMNIKISETMSEVKISKENLIKSYNEADKATKKTPEAIFGKDMFQPKNIMARVRTFNDACRELGDEHPFVKEWHLGENLPPNLEAYLQLRIVVAALNEGWEPQFTKDEVRWYPWFWLYTQKELDEMSVDEKRERRMMDVRGRVSEHYAGFGYALSYYTPSFSGANFGSRLCLKSEELATYCGKQFIDLWSYFNLG